MNCLFTWNPEKNLKQFFQNHLGAHLKLSFVDKKNEEELLAKIKTTEVLVGWHLNQEILEQAPNLKHIFYPAAGIQHLSEEIKASIIKREITFCNSHGNSFSTAQHACALLLSLSNKIPIHHNHMKAGNWRTGDNEGKTWLLKNKKVGLLGFGAIGKTIYQMLQGFSCEFHIYKRSKNKLQGYEANYYSETEGNLAQFLSKIDLLICSLPQTPKTKALLNTESIKKLKPGSLFINIGRGGVVEEKALFDALKSKHLAGAALDVWYNYQPSPNSENKKYPYNYPFHELENVILSPHRGGSPLDDPNRFTDIIENLNFLATPNKTLMNKVSFKLGY